jgi:ABC-2 type transport system permease protein
MSTSNAMSGWPLSSRLMALGTLFALTLRQHIRGRRLLIMAGLFLLPVGLAVFASQFQDRREQNEFAIVLSMIPVALAPLTALLYASGMIQDEIEDQTLTYLLIRPISKWSLYTIKLLATFLTTFALTAVFTTITEMIVYWTDPNLWGAIVPTRTARIVTLLSLATWAYSSIFGCLSLFIKRSLVFGVAYIIVFEGMLNSIDFAVRRITVMYYFRTLAARWLEMPANFVHDWAIDLETAPTTGQCTSTLLIASLFALALSAWIFSTREFRVKTPEGN